MAEDYGPLQRMKQLFLVALVIFATIVVHDFFIAAPGERRVFPNEMPSFVSVSHRPPAYTPPPAPKVVNAPAAEQADEKGAFVPPKFESIESITRNWTWLPPHAFPRQVKLRTPVLIKMAAGSSTLSDGAEVTAHGISEGMLSVSPTPTSTARGSLPISGTDLVDELTRRYTEWVQARIDRARHAWEYRQQQEKTTASRNAPPVTTPDMLDSGGRPVRNKDGGYDLILSRIRAGVVTDIDPDRITGWGTPTSIEYQGKPYWGVDIFFVTDTIFGPFDVQARAYIRDGEVVHWRYPSSDEPVL